MQIKVKEKKNEQIQGKYLNGVVADMLVPALGSRDRRLGVPGQRDLHTQSVPGHPVLHKTLSLRKYVIKRRDSTILREK